MNTSFKEVNEEEIKDDIKEDIKKKSDNKEDIEEDINNKKKPTIKTFAEARKRRNKKKKMINGNINSNRLKIMQINKGNSPILNKFNEIKDMICEKNPDILVIN